MINRKRIDTRGLAIAMAVSCMLSLPFPAMAESLEYGPGIEQDAFLAPYVTQSMCSADYWTSQFKDGSKELLTKEQIKELNAKIMATPEANVVDLGQLEPVFNGTALRNRLADFTSPANLYLNGNPVPESYYQAIRNNISGAAVNEQMPLRYGFAVNHTIMKAYPYSEFLSDSQDDFEWDNLSAAGIYVNEPLAVYFFTQDGRFAYVKSTFCSGWVPAEDIAVCKDKAEWDKARTMENILVVTGEKVYLEPGAYTPEFSEKRLAMGTVLERLSNAEGSVDGRQVWNNYVVKIPCRAADGSFFQKTALVPMNRDVSTKYLKYTAENVLEQAFKCLGNRYGWGGMLYSQDCSGYVRDIYRCFGLSLPRNTTWQSQMPVEVQSLETMSDEEKEHVLDDLMPGSILQFKGHEMIYLGSSNGKYYTINDVSSLAAADDTSDPLNILRVRSVIVNDLTTKRRNGHTWLSDLNKIIKVYHPL